MSSIMAVIGLEQQDLSAFELKRKNAIFYFLYKYQPVSAIPGQNINV